jgi:hypothetical protein
MAPEVMNSTPEGKKNDSDRGDGGIGGGSNGLGASDGVGERTGSGPVYGLPVDVYSYAIVLWELTTRQVCTKIKIEREALLPFGFNPRHDINWVTAIYPSCFLAFYSFACA